MPPLHVIRLGDAWEAPAAADGCVRLERRFGRPSGLAEGDRVVLAIAGCVSSAEATLNDSPLPAIVADAGRWAHDVTPLLRDRNRLVLWVAESALDEGDRGRRGRGALPSAVGVVTIEIVAPA